MGMQRGNSKSRRWTEDWEGDEGEQCCVEQAQQEDQSCGQWFGKALNERGQPPAEGVGERGNITGWGTVGGHVRCPTVILAKTPAL